MRKFLLASLAAGAIAAVSMAAQAQTLTQQAAGKVQAFSKDQITLVSATGAVTTVKLGPNVNVMLATPIKVSDIAPGSYIGTTNYAKPDGTGRSLEVHVWPAGAKGPGVDFVMDANAGTTMTNGVVDTVVESEGGRVLAVNHGAGVRRITVPPSVPVVLNTPSDVSHVVPGAMARVGAFTSQGGPTMQFITIETGAH